MKYKTYQKHAAEVSKACAWSDATILKWDVM